MTLRRILVLLLAFALPLGIGLMYLRATPRLLEVSPERGSELVPAGSSIQLTFSRPMQTQTVTENLSIDPPQPGEFTWDGDTLTFSPAQPWPGGSTVNVQLAPGARSTLGIPMLRGETWSFNIGSPRLIYLWPVDGPADIYSLEPTLGEIQRLTTTSQGVLEYHVSPEGTTVYYSAANITGGSDLFRLDRPRLTSTRLLACPEALCRMPQVSPKGDWLAYQRIPVPGETPSTSPQVRLLTLSADTPMDDILVTELTNQTNALSWSSNGLLAYHDEGQGAFIIHDPVSGKRVRIRNLTGQPGTWSPNGRMYIAAELLLSTEDPGSAAGPLVPSHLIRFDRLDGSLLDLSRGEMLEDASPVFSPDGEQIAFGRKYLDPPRWTPGRQLWLMRPDGSQARPLTEAPLFNHSDFAWSPDGSQLAMMRFNQSTLTEPPEIWLMDANGSNALRLVIGGYGVQWIP